MQLHDDLLHELLVLLKNPSTSYIFWTTRTRILPLGSLPFRLRSRSLLLIRQLSELRGRVSTHSMKNLLFDFWISLGYMGRSRSVMYWSNCIMLVKSSWLKTVLLCSYLIFRRNLCVLLAPKMIMECSPRALLTALSIAGAVRLPKYT